MKELLIKLKACEAAREWAGDKSWPEIFATCYRGDWLLWLFYHTAGDKRLLTLAKGHCVNTVRHLMKDERSVNAVDVAIRYGNGEATNEELRAAAAAAYAAAAAAYADAAAADAAAADAAAAAADAAAADAAAAAAAAAAYAATKENQQLTADICRKYLPIEVWNITEDGQLITKNQ